MGIELPRTRPIRMNGLRRRSGAVEELLESGQHGEQGRGLGRLDPVEIDSGVR